MLQLWAIFVLFLASGQIARSQGVTEPNPSDEEIPFGDVRNCPSISPIFPDEPLLRMEVLPGAGFDALRSIDMGQVHDHNYSTCRISNDGRFLVPDSIFVVPLKESSVEVFSEYIERWQQFTSTLSASISLEASYLSKISGSFSSEYQMVKSHMYRDSSVSTRVQLRNVLYKVKIQPSSPLHPTFKTRLLDIAANIQHENYEYAHYLAELTVREYGTHYVTSVDAGAVLSQVDFITASEINDQSFSRFSVSASASGNFLGKFSFGSSFNLETTQTNKATFESSRTYSELYSWGGPPFGPNLTIQEWEKGVINELVGIDRSGNPIYFAITTTTLPELSLGSVYDVANYVSEAISRYYMVNTHPGCTDVTSPSFDFQANVNDDSCSPPSTNFTFGGIFQTCDYITEVHEPLCTAGRAPFQQLNPLTGATSCREPFVAILLHSGQISHSFQRQSCHEDCDWWGRCNTNCDTNTYTTTANYKAYWCVTPSNTMQNSGYLFGGFYTSTDANPYSGSQACPRFYMPLHFGEDIFVCVSNDYELGLQYAVPFAGFLSCTSGNPLALTNPNLEEPNSWPKSCPLGYTQHLVTVEDDCEINFCVRVGSLNEIDSMPPKLPPYRKLQFVRPNTTSALYLIGKDNFIWVKNIEGRWELGNGSIILPNSLRVTSNNTDSSSGILSTSLSAGEVAGIAIALVTVIVSSIIIVIVIGVVRKRRKSTYKNTLNNNEGGDQNLTSNADQHERGIVLTNVANN